VVPAYQKVPARTNGTNIPPVPLIEFDAPCANHYQFIMTIASRIHTFVHNHITTSSPTSNSFRQAPHVVSPFRLSATVNALSRRFQHLFGARNVGDPTIDAEHVEERVSAIAPAIDNDEDNGWGIPDEEEEVIWEQSDDNASGHSILPWEHPDGGLSGDYDRDDSDSLVLIDHAASSPRSSESGDSSASVDPKAQIGLALSSLYEELSKVLPDDFPCDLPIRPNCWLPPQPEIRPMLPDTAAYCKLLLDEATRCKNIPALIRGKPEAPVELLEDLSGQLSKVLSSHPPSGMSAALTDACAKLHARLLVLRRRFGAPSDPMAATSLKVCEEKMRAIVIDVATSANLAGNALVKFIEKVYVRDAPGMLQCTMELPPPKQGEIFDRSRTLGAALGIGDDFKTRMIEKKNEWLRLSQGGHPITPLHAIEGHAHAVIHTTRDSIKNRSLRRVEQHFDTKAASPASRFPRLKQLLFKPQPPDSDELRTKLVVLFGEGSLFVPNHERRTTRFVAEQGPSINASTTVTMLTTVLLQRAAKWKATPNDQRGGGQSLHRWVDHMIDSLFIFFPEVFRELKDENLAKVMATWLCRFTMEKSIPSQRLHSLLRQIHATALTMQDGPRCDMLLHALQMLKNDLPEGHTTHLLINSALLRDQGAWLKRHGMPHLINILKREELQLYPRLIALGHAFRKHVEGRNNLDGREFDDIFDLDGGKNLRRQQYEDHVRNIMMSPDHVYINRGGTLYFYDEGSNTVVFADPCRHDGGGAYRPSKGYTYFTNKMVEQGLKRLPNDFYARLDEAGQVDPDDADAGAPVITLVPEVDYDSMDQPYVACEVSSQDVTKYLDQFRDEIGEEQFARYTAKRIARDGGKFHLTVISAAEYDAGDYDRLKERLATVPDLAKIFKDGVQAKILGLGGVSDDDGNTAAFAVVRCDALDDFRCRYGLRRRDFHITLGFSEKDVHFVGKVPAPKDKSSLEFQWKTSS
jgi:hypothetical protein